MNPRPSLSLLTLASALGLAACGGGGGGASDEPIDPAAFVAAVDHSYFPLVAGRVWTYEGEDEGVPVREEVRTLEERRVILGVPCTALQEILFLDGELTEVTTEWFAQDERGNVWKFGEESLEFDGVDFQSTDDSWIAGEGDARAWIAFVRSPRVGHRYVGYKPGGSDVLQIESITESVTVPAGAFQGCMKILENPEDPADSDIILYAPGVGRVTETNASGHMELVSMEP